MPRPAVGMRPSASCYAPAVPRGLRLCREGFVGHAFYICAVRRRVGRSDFRAPAVPRGLRLCRGGFGEHAFYIRAVRRRVGRSDFRTPAVPRELRLCRAGFVRHAFAIPDVRRRVGRSDFRAPAVPRGLRLCREGCGGFAFYIRDVRRRGGSFFIHYVKFFPDVHIDSFTPHRPPARGHGGGAVFSRRERTVAHSHARTARFGGASGHSRGRISAPPRRGFATLCPLAPPMVGGLGSTTAAPDAGAGTRGDFDPPRQPTCRFLGLCAGRPRGVSPSPGGERGDVPPLDACAPPPAASAAPSGGGLRLSRAPDPPTPRVAASLTGLPPVALGPPGGERGDVPPLDACPPPSAASAADSSGGLRLSRAPDPPTLRVAASLTGLPPVALALVSHHADAPRVGVLLLGAIRE